MEKSYILKFSQTKGDYVIAQQNLQESGRRKNIFEAFSNNFFRKRDQNQLKAGLNRLENSNITQNLTGQNDSTQPSQPNIAQPNIAPPSQIVPNVPNSNQNMPNQTNLNENNANNGSNNVNNGMNNQNNATNNQNNATNNQNNSNLPPNNQNNVVTPPNFQQPLPNNQNGVGGGRSVSDSLPLFVMLYSKFRVLNMIYQNLSSINNNFAQTFNDFENINTSLLGGLLNIYTDLTNGGRIPQNGVQVPSLPSDANGILQIVAEQIQDMREINFQLMTMFEVDEIDRHLALIDTALSIQSDAVTNFRLT